MSEKLKGRTISDQIRAAVDASDESRYAIANATGLDHAHLSRFMTGQRTLSQDKIDGLCSYLGLRLVMAGNRVQSSKGQ